MKSNPKGWAIGLALGWMALTPAVQAHTDAVLDTQKAPQGGQLRVAGPYHLELVAQREAKGDKDLPLVVFVTDHDGKKISTQWGKANATLLSSKLKASIPLQPDGDNRLKGSAKYASDPDLKVAVTLTLPGKAAEQARFTPFAR